MESLISSDIIPLLLPPSASILIINRVSTLLSTRIYQTETLLLLGLACLYLVLYKSWLRYQKSISQGRLKQLAGCQPAVGYPHRERILGLDLLWICTKSLRNHTFLETTKDIVFRGQNTVEYLVLGNKAIITIEPENIKTVLSLKFQDFGLGNARKQSLKPLFGDGVFNVDGVMWNHSRAFLRPHIARQKDGVWSIFEGHVQNLIEALPTDGSTFDIQDLFACVMMDIATEVFLGESTNVLKSSSHHSEGRAFAQAFEYATLAVCGRGQIDIYEIIGKLFGDRKLKGSFRIIDNFLDRVIRNTLEGSQKTDNGDEKENEPTFLEDLLKDTQDHQRVKHEILNLLIAGKDSVTALISNTWFMLAKHPAIYTKLRAEIAPLNGAPPTAQQLKDLKYLRHVLNESLRLFPPVPLNQRTAEADTFLPLGGGADARSPLFVAKGTSVGFSVYALHRRRDVYGEDAGEFRPERWGAQDREGGEERGGLRPGWAFLPFNGGPRACLGQQYALKKVSYVLVRLVQHFERVESRDPQDWQERVSLTCFSRNGVQVGLVPVQERL